MTTIHLTNLIIAFCTGGAVSCLVCGMILNHRLEMRKLELERDDLERRVIMLADQRWPRSKS